MTAKKKLAEPQIAQEPSPELSNPVAQASSAPPVKPKPVDVGPTSTYKARQMAAF